MGTKRKRSGSLGLAEPFHRNFTEYTKLCTFFTQKIGFWKFIRYATAAAAEAVCRADCNKKPAAIARSRS